MIGSCFKDQGDKRKLHALARTSTILGGQVEERLQLPHVLLEARLALLHAFEEKRGEEAHRDSQHLRDALARHGILEEGERAHREHHATKGAGRELANGALGVGGVFERAHARVGKAVGIGVEAEAEHAVVERTRRVEGLRVEGDACGAYRCGATVNEWWRGKHGSAVRAGYARVSEALTSAKAQRRQRRLGRLEDEGGRQREESEHDCGGECVALEYRECRTGSRVHRHERSTLDDVWPR